MFFLYPAIANAGRGYFCILDLTFQHPLPLHTAATTLPEAAGRCTGPLVTLPLLVVPKPAGTCNPHRGCLLSMRLWWPGRIVFRFPQV